MVLKTQAIIHMPLMILSLGMVLNYTILSNRPFKLDMIDLDYKIGLAR